MDTNIQATLMGGSGSEEVGDGGNGTIINNSSDNSDGGQGNSSDYSMRILDKPDETMHSMIVPNLFGNMPSPIVLFPTTFATNASPFSPPSPTADGPTATSILISSPSSSSSSASTSPSAANWILSSALASTSSSMDNNNNNLNNSSSSNSNGCNTHQHKKCLYHRLCCRNQQHHQVQMMKLNENNVNSGSGSSTSTNTSGPNNRNCSPTKSSSRDAISTNVTPQLNAALLADRYLLMDLVEGSSLYRCMDIKTQEELVCKIANNPCSNLLTAHFRLDGHQHVNYLQKVIQGSNQTYLFFTPSQGDLHSHVRVRRRLRENETKRLFRQMCEVVKTCHEQGIVLRDLKLRKFVFADAERTHLKLESLEDAVVLDNPAEDLLQDKRGCPAYVSPEILRANTTYSGKAADMWSLGVILYTMLVGRYPFNDSEHASLFAKISRGHFLVPDCLSSKARCIIRSLLRRDPEERITSEDILYHPWLKHDETKDIPKVAQTNNDDHCVPEWLDDSQNCEML